MAPILSLLTPKRIPKLCDAVGGAYVRLSLNSDVRINPFDLPKVIDSEEANDALRANLVTLHGLFRLMLGGNQISATGQPIPALTPNEEADLDQALIDTYARAGITSDPLTHQSPPPTIINLYDTLLHMEGTGPNLPNVFANTLLVLSPASFLNTPILIVTTK